MQKQNTLKSRKGSTKTKATKPDAPLRAAAETVAALIHSDSTPALLRDVLLDMLFHLGEEFCIDLPDSNISQSTIHTLLKKAESGGYRSTSGHWTSASFPNNHHIDPRDVVKHGGTITEEMVNSAHKRQQYHYIGQSLGSILTFASKDASPLELRAAIEKHLLELFKYADFTDSRTLEMFYAKLRSHGDYLRDERRAKGEDAKPSDEEDERRELEKDALALSRIMTSPHTPTRILNSLSDGINEIVFFGQGDLPSDLHYQADVLKAAYPLALRKLDEEEGSASDEEE